MNFDEFWRNYPARGKLKGTKKLAERRWNGLSRKRQQRAYDSLPHYGEFLGQNGWRQPMHVSTYLNPTNEHWETYLPDLAEQIDRQDQQKRIQFIRERNKRRREALEQKWRREYEQRYGRDPG